MKVHLAYAVPPAVFCRSRIGAGLQRLTDAARKSLGLEPSYRRGCFKLRVHPLPAPYSITYHLSRFLSARVATCTYDWCERISPAVEPDDIILGHPHWDPDSVIQRLFREEVKCSLKALIFPIHHAMPSINTYALPLAARADIVFGVMGRYWYDTLEGSVFGPCKGKIVRLDMAVDAGEYPFVKKRFNPPGRRGYLYIGNNRPEKGIHVLSKTMAALSDFPRGWIGAGEEIPNMERLARRVNLTPELVSRLAERYDFFVNTSVSDANPTTILEAMAWGFPVACTPQSGYYSMRSVITLSVSDFEANARALLELQYAPEEHLASLSSTNRKLVETQHDWERFCGTVWETLQARVAQASGRT